MLNGRASPIARPISTTMPRHRLFVAQPIRLDEALEIDGERAHYLSRVLRLKVGSEVTLFDGSGDEFVAQVAELRKNRVELRVRQKRSADVESILAVRLVQGVTRGERMDFVVQKATELGVSRIQPVISEFSVVKLNRQRALRRTQHWRKIAQSACEQCGRNRIPQVAEPMPLSDFLARDSDAECRVLFDLHAEGTLRDLPAPSGIDLMIGPEGGLSEREHADAVRVGFVPVSMGPRILRAETAALTALALVQGRWGDLQA